MKKHGAGGNRIDDDDVEGHKMKKHGAGGN
jgi:hypothetical protein